MTALVKKEIRLLLPSFGIALVLALSIWLIPATPSSANGQWLWLIILPLLLCPALVVMTALDSFGREISSNTFANLLAQPVSRSRVWWTKSSVLALALGSVFGVWWLSILLHAPPQFSAKPEDLHEMFTTACLLVLTVYAGGLCSVLLFRQVGAAFWFTLLVPAALAMLVVYLTGKFDLEIHTERNLVTVLGAYSVAGFIWARRLFLRAQDVQWTGGEIGLPAWIRLPRRTAPSERITGRRPLRALIRKELQLHQSQFVIAGVLALVHLALVVVRNTHGHLPEAPALEFVVFQFWALWLVMPLLIGCAAVAEERKLGTMEGQLCLPARRWTQFASKFAVSLILALLFGVALPLVFEGGRILPEFSATFIYLLIAISLVAISFYASTLVRNTLQAIAPAILGILIVWALLLGAISIQDFIHYPLWRGKLVYLIGIPVQTAALGWLMYWNFKQVLVGWPVWRRNLVVFLSALAFVIVATTVIYQRAWELFIPLKTTHGPARWASTDAVRMKSDGIRLSVQFANGRAWSTRLFFETGGFTDALLGDWKLRERSGSFVEGTNWASVAFCVRDVMALRKDGSLWVSEQPNNPRLPWRNGEPPRQEETKLVRFGNDSDWKELAGLWMSTFALKNDGTLWFIGTNRFNGKSPWPGLRSFAAQRLGTNTDWADLDTLNSQVLLRKTDGQVYIYPLRGSKKNESILLADDMPAERVPNLDQHRWRGVIQTASRRFGVFQVGVTDDGRFCVAADYQLRNGQYELVWQNLQLGSETNWLAVAGSYRTTVTLKADGTLWAWEFLDNPVNDQASAKATQLGTHSDWRAITDGPGGVVSLAADGSLWQWRFDDASLSSPPLVRPTRRPQLIGNIFGVTQ